MSSADDGLNTPERERVRQMIAAVDLAPDRGIAVLTDSDGRRVEFSTLSDIQAALEELAAIEINDSFGWDGDGRYMGNDGSMLYPPAREFVAGELAKSIVSRFFEERDQSQQKELLYELAASLVNARNLEIELVDVTDAVIRYLAQNPHRMYELHPEKFEELVAAIFRDRGYEVEVTPRSHDGGRDLIALYKQPFGHLLTLVECKRFARHRRIGPALVRQLYGVVERERVNHGILATTSFFTPGAQEFAIDLQYRLSLRDYDHVVEWCRGYRKLRP